VSALIECRALSKRYGGTRALDGIELDLDRGAPIALVGPNGAGKTTLFSVLCGFVRASGGKARVLGEPTGSAALRGRIGALPQDASLAPGFSVHSQLMHLARLQGLPRATARTEAERVLERVRLSEAGGNPPESLSHGMRKRIAFAQALLGRPELLLLDEPTAGVDPPNVRVIHALIRELAGEVDVLISSHNLDELERLTERVITLESGRVSARGRLADERHEATGADRQGRLSVTLDSINDTASAAESLGALPRVTACRIAARGDLLLNVDDENETAQAVIAMLGERGVRWRSIVRGRSLEERLYDDQD